MIFTALNQTLSGSLQGVGKVFAPATGLLIGCIVKFGLNVLLIRQTAINIYGAPISSVVCQVIAFSYSFFVLKKQVTVKIDLSKHILKPLIAALSMGAAAFISYSSFFAVLKNNMICAILAIAVAAAVYALAVAFLRILNEEER